MPTRSTPSPERPASVRRFDRPNLDRAREGLRVIEDWCVSAWIAPDLVRASKDMRQRAGSLPRASLQNSAPATRQRWRRRPGTTPPSRSPGPRGRWGRLMPSGVQEAPDGVLEEFGRSSEPPCWPARGPPGLRYALYDWGGSAGQRWPAANSAAANLAS